MNEDRPLDLSSLDPHADPDRWRAVLDATLTRTELALARRAPDPLSLIASWSRTLTVAAVVVVTLLIPVELMLERREATVEQVRRFVQLSAEAARGDQHPSGEDLARALTGGDLP